MLAVLLVLLRRRLAVLLVLLLGRRLRVLLVLLLGRRLAIVPLLLRGRRALHRGRRGRVGVFPLLGVIVLLRRERKRRTGRGGETAVRRPHRDGKSAHARQWRWRDATLRNTVDARRASRIVSWRRATSLGSAIALEFDALLFADRDHAPTPWGAASTAVPRTVSAAGTG